MSKRISQRARIADYLKQGHRINQMDALAFFGCMRLAARIGELRDDGWPIQSKVVKVGERKFTSYRLA